MALEIIDIGANLAHDSFDDDRDEMMQRAADAGVFRMIVTGSSEHSNAASAELAEQSGGVLYSTAGGRAVSREQPPRDRGVVAT